LPAARAERLSPQQRGALVRLLGRWIEERPAPVARLVAADFELSPAAAAALLTWLP
jgi:hypothetical protein